MRIKNLFYSALVSAVALGFSACSNDVDGPNYGPTVDIDDVEGLFVVNAGNYGYGNASLTFFNPETGVATNDLFATANSAKLGDCAQSMTIDAEADVAWVVVNNSNVMYKVSIDEGRNFCKELGRVTGLVSPRYAMLVDGGRRLYVSQMYSAQIAIVDAATCTVTGHIDVPGMDLSEALGGGSTEEFATDGRYIYTNCWSYQKNIVKIDPTTDKVVATLEVGIQPKSMAYDGNGILWVLCDGGSWDQNPVGYVTPTIVAVDTKEFKVLNTTALTLGNNVSSLNYYAGSLYWIDGSNVKRLCITGCDSEPEDVVTTTSWGLYALTVNPANGDIYVADALDYMQAGIVTRYDNTGRMLSTFKAGVIPTGFAWLIDD